MKEGIKCLHVSFDSAALETREKVSFGKDELSGFLKLLLESNFAQEFFLLSTCNRTEIYYYSAYDLKEQFVRHLCEYKTSLQREDVMDHVHAELNGVKAVHRLFCVASGLMSQVVGDFQIIRQLKDAYEMATQAGSVGRHLHRLLQLVFASHKDVSTFTKIHSGNSSVASVAAEVTRRFLRRIHDPRILIIGAGSFSREILLHLKKGGFSAVMIANRNIEKAKELSSAFGTQWIALESIEYLDEYDVVITCISARRPIIGPRHFRDNHKRKLLVDLSVPRAIDPLVQGVSTITLMNLDQICEENSRALQVRKNSIPKALKIIDSYCEEFRTREAASQARPVLNTLKTTMEKIRAEEVNRFLKKSASPVADAELIEIITKSIINKIMRSPAVRLNDSATSNDQEADKLSDALVKLFNLEMPAKMAERR